MPGIIAYEPDAMDVLEHARKHCVQTMPLHTQRQATAYLHAMEIFQKAFWDIVKESKIRRPARVTNVND